MSVLGITLVCLVGACGPVGHGTAGILPVQALQGADEVQGSFETLTLGILDVPESRWKARRIKYIHPGRHGTGRLLNVSEEDERIYMLRWEDGRYSAEKERYEGPVELWVLDFAGGIIEKRALPGLVMDDGRSVEYHLPPDGKFLAYYDFFDFRSAHAVGEPLKVLLYEVATGETRTFFSDHDLRFSWIRWASNEELMYHTWPSGVTPRNLSIGLITRRTLSGEKREDLYESEEGSRIEVLEPSPNGKYVAMLEQAKGQPTCRLRVLDARTKQVCQEFEDSFPKYGCFWSPDETHIAYVSGKGVGVYSLVDRKKEIIAKSCGRFWGILQMRFLDDDRIVFTDAMAEGMMGYHLHLVDLTNGQRSRLYSHRYDIHGLTPIDGGRKIVLQTRVMLPPK